MSLNTAAALARPVGTIFGEKGYCDSITLSAGETAELRRLTVESWLAVIRGVAPDKVAEFEAAGVADYHLRAHLLDHARLWTTQTRTFDAAVVDRIRSFDLFRMFERDFPGYRIASAMPPYGDLGRARINWRLVRPGDDLDIGPAHADYWFDAVLDGWSDEPRDIVGVKVWIPIFVEEGLTGFAYVPGSHRRHYPFEAVRFPDGTAKPTLDERKCALALETLDVEPGRAVIFSYNLVHRGANSAAAQKTRVSMEFTLEVPRSGMERLYGDLRAFY